MKSKLPSPILLALVGAVVTVVAVISQGKMARHAGGAPASGVDAAAPSGGASPEQLADLVQRAILTLQSRQTVSAKVRQSIDLFGKRLLGSGTYLEGRGEQGPMFRFEMRVQLDNQISSWMDVSDGRYLWRYRERRGEPELQRVDLVRIGRAFEEMGTEPQVEEMGQWLGMGGLARMLGRLNSSFDFVAIQRDQFGGQVPVWKLEGRWKRGQLMRALPEQAKAIKAGKPADLGKLSEHLPDRVVLLLGVDDLFPYRVEYRRKASKKSGDETAGDDRILTQIDFFEVNVNVPIDPARFMYNPPKNVGYVDETEKILLRLGAKK